MPKVNPNGESACAAMFGASEDPRRDGGLVARVYTADPMERRY